MSRTDTCKVTPERKWIGYRQIGARRWLMDDGRIVTRHPCMPVVDYDWLHLSDANA